MATVNLQLKGNLMLGPITADTDVSAYVTAMTIKRSRTSIGIPATLATGEDSEAAGAGKTVIELAFFSDFSADSIWDVLNAALDTPASELLFEGTLEEGVVSATNPKWTGTLIVMGVDTGGVVGALRSQSVTYPVKQGTLVKSIIP